MGTQLEKLVIEAMTMSAVDRAVFARMLLESLPTELGHDEIWEQEVDRRVAAIDNGATKLIPIDEALLQLRSLLK
jgi:putative addiction module component (TIGR02574 family)